MNKNMHNVIVIGAGIGGLTTASLLSRDHKVLVFEKNKVLGGYCSDFKRGGFRFEVAVQAINGFYAGSPLSNVLKKSEALKGIEVIKPGNLYRAIYPDYDIVVPQSDLICYKKKLISLFPKEEKGIKDLFDTMKSIYMEMLTFYNGSSLKKSPFILKYCRKPLRDLLDEFIRDDKLKAIIAQYWMYRGLPPSKLSSITFAYIWYDYTANGSYFLKEGTAGIVKNLARAIKANGGDIMEGVEVCRLRIEKDRVCEIELKDGRRFQADTFISNMDVFKTFNIMTNAGKRDDLVQFLKKLRENTLSISAFKIYLGLDVDARSLGVMDYEIFVSPEYDMESMYQASMDNEPQRMPYTVTIYSNLSNQFCESKKTVVSIGALSGYEFWRNLSRADYRKKKAEIAEVILERYEKFFPNLRKHIKVKVVSTPLTMERYTGNSGGSIYGWNRKNLVEEVRFIHPTTPIKNLLLSSHWTKMGGGVGGVLLASDRVHKLLSTR